ncbi:type I restriction-modification system S protein [Helicobacter mustelae]|uniref:restriction endonuclease subunit S n=1 Tax=Helicobacter mustelae TaxID=217 RepID=UPI000E0176B9|nr:restriction endonuclease subunit S [Helicobacter mustelae]STP12711.1 type I restriction-modification system S protein [Helicobacter mustelae]
MNSVEKLLQTLCPYGVEFRKLGEVIKYEQPNKYCVASKDFDESYPTPVLTAGKTFILGYTNETHNIYPADKISPVIIFDDFTTAIQWVDFPFKVKSSAMKILLPKDSTINIRFIFFTMQTIPYSITVEHSRQWISKYSQIPIPLPPLEVQREIVKILDTFTQLNTELNTELKLRKKQYEYYRNWLLSFSDVDASKEGAEQRLRDKSYPKALKALLLSLCPYGVEFRKLGEVGRFTRGNGLLKSNLQTHGKPVVHYGQIYTRYGLATEKTISYVSETLFAKLKKAKPKDILIAVTSENVKDVGKSTVWLGDEEVAFSGEMYSYSTDQNPKFIAYYFQTSKFQKEKEKIVTGTKVIRIHEDDLKQIKIPLPPLEVQREIVKILDDFSTLTEDLSSGIPAEIAARKKQYEYYRDKLLTFTPLIKEGE